MSGYEQLTNAEPIRLLLMGHSGTGKTGALLSLLRAGFNVRIIEFDPNGIKVLGALLRDETPEVRSRLRYELLRDQLQIVGQEVKPVGTPAAFLKGMELLKSWKDSATGEDLSSPQRWSMNEVLVLDTLTFAAHAALRLIKHSRPDLRDFRQIIGEAQKMCWDLLYALTALPCHVIVNAHLKSVEQEGTGILRFFPQAVGAALSPQIMQQFSTALLAKVSGSGNNAKRIIATKPDAFTDVKFPVLSAPAELPIDTALADIFKLLGAGPAAAPAAVKAVAL